MRPWIGPLALWLISCGSSSSDNDNNTATGTTAVVEDPAKVDFAPQASTDGQKAVFLSRRVAGVYRVYVYNESAATKLTALSEGIPIEPLTDELGTSLSDDGAWILTWRSGAKNELLLNSFDSTQKTSLELTSEARLRELTLAPSGQRFFAYTERKAGADTVFIYSFTASLGLTKEAEISGEYGAQFAVSGSDVYVFTRKADASGVVTVQYRKRSAGLTWDLQTGSLTLKSADAALPSAASAQGLIYPQSLDAVRLKTKLGTFTTESKEYQTNVGIVQEASQFQAFDTTPVDFSLELYRKNQPLTLGSVSTTADGAYMLLSGYDAWFCKNRTQSNNLMVLVRLSDGFSLPLIPTRETGTEPWTGVVAEPCSYFDQETIPKPQDFDVTTVNGQILSVNGSRVTLIFESRYTGDREIRRLSFDVSDWTAKTYANPVFTEISANHR
ncbi:MAG TPA: hypothetical protein VE954_40780 [Oligoflexus sp.]|uniref:hypothetical protein n=1 Tax=Oligoflexus sp. TaxID=1971216 RepID=UPI002D4AB3F4|nr:hypothetical protein [Oligoflexus sp.]HYX39477.1 hypothetical protein [Oligoflexus sp.]